MENKREEKKGLSRESFQEVVPISYVSVITVAGIQAQDDKSYNFSPFLSPPFKVSRIYIQLETFFDKIQQKYKIKPNAFSLNFSFQFELRKLQCKIFLISIKVISAGEAI